MGLRLRALLVGAALAAVTMGAAMAAAIPSASAAMRIAEDRGGQIGHYMRTFAHVRATGQQVVVDGNCLSACTLVLGLVPRDRICATPRARFGFHAAWMPDAHGRAVTSTPGTQVLWDLYPPRVRAWINRNGGLSRKMIFLQGRALAGIVPSCGSARSATAQNRSFRSGALRAFGDERASASRRHH
jgi:hypothetical protein